MKGRYEMRCLECNETLAGGKSLSNHIGRLHGLSGEDYTIKHFHNGVRPGCSSCGNSTRYTAFTFKKFCSGCSWLAMKEGGSAGGKASAWNLGLTAESDDRVRKASLKIKGSGNPFFGRQHDDITKTRISISKRLGGETIESRINHRESEFELITPLDDYISRQRQYLQFKCKECGHIQEKTLQAFERGSLCESCHPVSASQWQLEVEEWVSSLGIALKRGDRTVISPKEIDILIPQRNFGIECHGLYFHSDAKEGNDSKAHVRKADLADSNGIKLLQIFYDEWRDRNDIVKGMIKSRIGAAENVVGARKCEIVEIDAASQRQFFERSHLAGYSPARVAWGLKHDGQIVACLSLRAPRQRKWQDRFEISRFAVAPGFSVPGGLSRLSKVALEWSIRNGRSGLMTYVDRRVGTGEGYKKSGFRQVGATGPDYWYTDFQSRFDRFKFRASSGISERQTALNAKVFKIWGAGSRIMILGDT